MSRTISGEIIPWKYRTRSGAARIAVGIAAWRNYWRKCGPEHTAAIEITNGPISIETASALYEYAYDQNTSAVRPYTTNTYYYALRYVSLPGRRLYELMEPILFRISLGIYPVRKE